MQLSRSPALVLTVRDRAHVREHHRVLDPAELGALPLVDPRALRLEPGVVRLAGDRVHLPRQLRHPPAVDHVEVGRRDHQVDRALNRDDELVDRECAVRILVAPVELPALDLHGHLRAGRACRGHVLDARQLVEDDSDDPGEDHDWDRGPDQLQTGVSANLRAFRGPCAAPVAEAQDEEDERPFDDDEDHSGHGQDDPVEVANASGVRGVGRRHGSAHVGERRPREDERQCREAQTGGDELPAHGRWHSKKVGSGKRH
jgi:hypothetical protein